MTFQPPREQFAPAEPDNTPERDLVPLVDNEDCMGACGHESRCVSYNAGREEERARIVAIINESRDGIAWPLTGDRLIARINNV